MDYQNKDIGTILIERGSLAAEFLPLILEKLASENQRFGKICIQEGLISEEDLALALAEQFGLEFVDLSLYKVDEDLMATLPADFIHRFRIVPLGMDSESLIVAVSDPTDVLKLDELELLVDRQIQIRVATESAITDFFKAGTATSRVLREVSEDFMLQLVKENDHGEEILTMEGISEDTSPIIKLLNTTITGCNEPPSQ